MTDINSSLWDNTTVASGMQYDPESGSWQLSALGRRLRVKMPPEGMLTSEAPAQIVRDAVEAWNELAQKTHSATSDPNLSPAGVKNALEAPQRSTLFAIGQLAVQLRDFRTAVDQREQRLYSLPPLPAGAFSQSISEWELRSWFASLSVEQQGEMIEKAVSLGAEGEALIAAILRGPMPSLNPIIKMVREQWQASRRAGNVTEAEAIDAQRAAANWAFEHVSLCAAMVVQLCSTWLSRGDILDTIVSVQGLALDRSGFDVFGYSAREAMTAQQRNAQAA